MRLISGILQIIGILVVAGLGYWVYYTNWATNPNDKIAVVVAQWLPAPVKNWGCGRVNQRFAAEAPAFCSASAAPAPSDQPQSGDQKPAAPSGEGGKL